MIQWMNSLLINENTKGTASRETIVVAIGDGEQSQQLLHRAARIAHATNSQLIGLHVLSPGQPTHDTARTVRKEWTEELGGRYVEITSSDIPGAIITFAESEKASQIVAGSPGNGRLSRIQRPTLASELLGRQSSVEMHLIPTQQVSNRWRPVERRKNSSLLRNISGVIMGISILALMTRFFVGFRSDISVATSLSLYLLAVVAITALGGRWPGIVTAVCAPMIANWFLIPPYHTFLVNQRANLIELAVFVSTAFIVSIFVSNAEKQAHKADGAWREASTLSALTDSDAFDPTEDILKLLVRSFNLEGATLTDTTDTTPQVILSVGKVADTIFFAKISNNSSFNFSVSRASLIISLDLPSELVATS
jgi:two-component system sensor histidine kinase KdpD